jgi:hypothetical protein
MDGHTLREIAPRPSGWWARCECGEEFRAPRKSHALDAWYAHRDDAEAAEEGRGPALGRDHGVDPVDRLIAAWAAWENAPSAHWTAREKEQAITVAGLTGRAAHHHIAACRRQGMSIPDAVQSVINDSRRTT